MIAKRETLEKIEEEIKNHVVCPCINCEIDRDLLESLREKVGQTLKILGESSLNDEAVSLIQDLYI